jgi:hypothetical protein
VYGTYFWKGGEGHRRGERLVEVSVEKDSAITKADNKMREGGRKSNGCDLFYVGD